MKSVKLFPKETLHKLEFDTILNLTEELCISDLGKKRIEFIKPAADLGFILMALKQVDEMKSILQLEASFPASNYFDLSLTLNYLELENSVLSLEELKDVYWYSRTMEDIFTYLTFRKEKYPEIFNIIKNAAFESEITSSIKRIITDEGEIRPGISPELDKIRKEIKYKERELDQVFNKLKKKASENGWLESGEESVMGGRRVLMVLAENKRKIKGIVRDESATGKTIFLEPDETTELYNDLFEFQQAEKREIYKILRDLSKKLRPFVENFRRYQIITAVIDVIRAKALVAIRLNANLPVVKEGSHLYLLKAFNPSLLLFHFKSGKKTVPLNMQLNGDERILLISGPNAGGKSIALKTVGLLQIMVQSGFLVPCSPDSTFGVFEKIFIELGDEQSIENELSTFSSKLMNMKYFLANADEKTIFFIDEFGTGTDPKFGGAIAEAVLEEINHKKAFGVINSHYGNLKVMASKTYGIINGAMQFDKENLSPMYMLTLGNPGSSFAFEIAQKIGLPSKIIKRAGSKMEKDFQDYDKILSNLESERIIVESKKAQLEVSQAHFANLIETYEALKSDLERNKKKIEMETKAKAMESVNKTKMIFDGLMKDLKQEIKNESKQEFVRQEIKSQEVLISSELKALKDEKKKLLKEEIIEGSLVKLIDGQLSGNVEFIKNKKAYVLFGNVRTQVNLDELELVTVKKAKELEKKTVIDFAGISEEFKHTIDVRGMRGVEALQEVEQQLDKALIIGLGTLKILHGTGDGILRRLIRDNLKKYKFINRYYSEAMEFGGEGITIVEME